MKIGRTRIGRAPAKRRSSAQKLAEARTRNARQNAAWSELEQDDLVARPHGVLVSVDTDWAYLRHPGVVFEPASAAILATHATLHFYVDEDSGEPIFVERMADSWSQQIARQTRRAAS